MGPPMRPPSAPVLADLTRQIVPWRWWEAVLLFLVANIVIGQFIVGGVVYVVLGGTSTTDGGELGVRALLGAFLAAGADLPQLAAAAAGAIVGTGLSVLYLNQRYPGWPPTLGRPRKGGNLREVGVGTLYGPFLYVAVILFSGLVILVLDALVGRSVAPPSQLDAEGLSASGWVVATTYAVVIAPVVEEFFFRGLIFRSIRDRHGFWIGAPISAVLFGSVHYVGGAGADAVVLPIVMTLTGLGLAWIYERRGALAAPIGAHMAFNVIGIALIAASAN
jgi:membrane protease YdiL (CAAX protease family)